MNDPILDVKALGVRWTIKKETLFSHLSRGTPLPPFFRVGSKTLWKLSDIEAWEEAQLKEKRRKKFEK